MTSASAPKTGVLLVNLGSPDAPTPEALRPYLREFLTDPDVIDLPAVLRWPLVYGLIVPRRSRDSAALYQKIWTEHGSPLIHYSRRFHEALRLRLEGAGLAVELGMRYGNPSIRSALERLPLARLDRLVVFPLYPQYAQSSTLTVLKKVAAELGRLGQARLAPEWIPPFFADARYLEAVRAVSHEPFEAFQPDFSLFSFHGVPERHLKRLHPACFSRPDCSEQVTDLNRNCYRAQCFQTARDAAHLLGIPRDRYTISFQSRLGRTPWIQPFTDFVIRDLPARGVRKLAVFCLSFVADCLETLDEIENRERRRFLDAGGEELRLIPSLNDHPAWVDAAAEMVREVVASPPGGVIHP